jgi:hypothetical protein
MYQTLSTVFTVVAFSKKNKKQYKDCQKKKKVLLKSSVEKRKWWKVIECDANIGKCEKIAFSGS